MQFVQIGDDYINLAAIQHVTISREQDSVTGVTVRYLAGSATTHTYAGEEATALVAALERALTRGQSRDYRSS